MPIFFACVNMFYSRSLLPLGDSSLFRFPIFSGYQFHSLSPEPHRHATLAPVLKTKQRELGQRRHDHTENIHVVHIC